MKLYENIKMRRQALQLSQEELAKKLGYKSASTIAKIEAGKIDFPQSKIKDFADALETTPSALMGWDEESFAGNDEIKKCTFSANEIKLIKKYRQLDADGKQRIENQLNFEVEQIRDKESAPSGASSLIYPDRWK